MLKPRNAIRRNISDEELALIRLMSRISVVSNPLWDETFAAPQSKATRSCTSSEEDEARLLMNLVLMSPKPSTTTPPSLLPSSSNSPSSCYLTDCVEEEDDDDEETEFSFSCPGLSLFGNLNFNSVTSSTSPSSSSPSPRPPGLIPPKRSKCPQALLSRPVVVKQKSEIHSAANAILHNIGSTFDFAMESRIQSWKQSLSKVIELRRSRLSEQPKPDSSDSTENNLKEKTVLEALTKVGNDISVDVVRTSFHVLPKDDSNERPNKRVKFDSNVVEDNKSQHPLQFQARLDISCSSQLKYYVTLETSGIVTGKFSRDKHLQAVQVYLEMDTLLREIQKHSRLVVRKAAETEIVSLTNQKQTQKQSQLEEDMIPRTPPSSQAVDTTTMPPPPPREPNRSFGVVSPSPGSPKSPLMTSSPDSKLLSNTPPLVSPFPTSASDDFIPKSPSLPLLVQVACASFAAEKNSSLLQASS